MMRITAAGFVLISLLLTGVPASAGPTDDVRASAMKFAALNSFRATFLQQGQTGTMDFVRPDSYHIAGGRYEVIRIGNTSYMKMPGGGWMKTVIDPRRMMQTNILDSLRSAANRKFTADDLGMKSAGGESLHAYRLHFPNGNENDVIYIGRDGLPHQYTGTGGQSTRLSNFNAVPPIRAPI